MDAKTRPRSVTVISFVFIAAGVVGLVYHAADFKSQQSPPSEVVWISLIRLMAIVCGACMLTGRNWARWLAVAWMAYHAVLSAFHSWFDVAVHGAMLAVFVYVLFRRSASRYFRVSAAPAG